MRQVVDRPAVPLQAPAKLKPVAGFTQADVAALADRALDILKRSSAPGLTRLSPSAAVNQVFANQYAATTAEFKQDAISLAAGYDWQWLAASRYPKQSGAPSTPRTLKVTGKVSSGTDTIDTGEAAPFLTVTIQAHIVQTVTTPTYGRTPIVVRRTIQVSGFKPRGGPEWWPSVIARTTPFGNDGCSLFQGAILKPLTDPDDLRRDLASLRDSLATSVVAPDADGPATDPVKLRDSIEKEC